MKKIIFLLALTFVVSGIFAQTRNIFGSFTKSDGTKIKGTSTTIRYENQVIINGYTGGTDNSGVIEIDVPSGSYVADFRNMMNTAMASSTNKPALPSKAKTPVSNTVIKADVTKGSAAQLMQQSPKLQSVDISIITSKNEVISQITNKIILQDITILAVTDDYATNSSKIKLKATRIGWIYYTYEPVSRKLSNISKSGWDNEANKSWTNF